MRQRSVALTAGAVTLIAGACSDLTGNLSRIVALEIPAPATRSVEEGATLVLAATALDAAGASVPEAQIFWRIIDVDSGQIGFALDSTTGTVSATFPSSARVQARVEALLSGPITVTVTGAPDSIAVVGDTLITVPLAAANSAPLPVRVLDLTTDPEQAIGLTGKPVEYAITTIFGGTSGNFLVTNSDEAAPTDSLTFATTTGPGGQASAYIRKAGTILPDSLVVEVRTQAATGADVPGNPIRFLVVFEQGAQLAPPVPD